VSVVGTDVNATMTAELLKTDPDVCLDVLDQVTQVDRAVGVRKSGSNQDSSRIHGAVALLGEIVSEVVAIDEGEWFSTALLPSQQVRRFGMRRA
jgi:hypothetical protein